MLVTKLRKCTSYILYAPDKTPASIVLKHAIMASYTSIGQPAISAILNVCGIGSSSIAHGVKAEPLSPITPWNKPVIYNESQLRLNEMRGEIKLLCLNYNLHYFRRWKIENCKIIVMHPCYYKFVMTRFTDEG